MGLLSRKTPWLTVSCGDRASDGTSGDASGVITFVREGRYVRGSSSRGFRGCGQQLEVPFDRRSKIVKARVEDMLGWTVPNGTSRCFCPSCSAIAEEELERQRAARAARQAAELKRREEAARRQAEKDAAAELRRIARNRTHNHVRRSRELQAPGEHSTAEWLLKLEEFGHRCAYCGAEGEDFHRDHMVPLVDGGSNAIGNIVPACPSCNLSKGGKSGADLLRWIAGRRTAA